MLLTLFITTVSVEYITLCAPGCVSPSRNFCFVLLYFPLFPLFLFCAPVYCFFSALCRIFLRSRLIPRRCCPVCLFLGDFSKQLRKATVRLVISVRPCLRNSYRKYFREILFGIFTKICGHMWILVKTGHTEHCEMPT